MGRARRDCCTAALLVCGPLPRLGFGLLASRNWSCGFPAPFSAAPNAAAVTTAALSATFATAAFTASFTATGCPPDGVRWIAITHAIVVRDSDGHAACCWIEPRA